MTAPRARLRLRCGSSQPLIVVAVLELANRPLAQLDRAEPAVAEAVVEVSHLSDVIPEKNSIT